MWDAESCEGQDPRAIAFERHESGILRDKSFDSIGDKMTVRVLGKHFKNDLSFNGSAIQVATLFTPQQNMNGIILYDIRTSTQNTVSVGLVPPPDRFKRTLPIIFSGVEVFQPIMIPAGLGVYMQLNGDNYNIPVYMRWDYLNADGTVA
jgi:hypothetical protein